MLLALTVLTVRAQQRIPCIRHLPTDASKTRGILVYPSHDWDPQKIYRQPVILISFSDCDFSMDDPAAYYDRLLNEPGYNEGYGEGSVADYYRDQSGGLFNLQFDVYGPFKVDIPVRNGTGNRYGEPAMKAAIKQLSATPGVDFSIYDWDADSVQMVNQLFFIAAGLSGNQVDGYIWPNTSFGRFEAPGGLYTANVSITCELWKDSTSCGIGTICHEFAHCLGLPDIYPTVSNLFSVVDEWDLMDGGNYTNKGWCPPNFSATEKMLMNWSTPTELTGPTTVTGMKPVSEGGEAYIIRNSGNEDEFYVLENRRHTKWDYGLPGQGLLIFHVDYDREIWSNNMVNTSERHYRYDIFHADGKDYKTWDPANNGLDYGKYTMDNWMRNRYLCTSVYPYADSLTVNCSLTDESDPVAALFTANADGLMLMSKPVTNIRMADDGTISFDFMGGATAIGGISTVTVAEPVAWYDLNGSRLPSAPSRPGIYIVRYSDGTTRKVIK